MSKWLYKGNKIENIEDFGDKTPFGFVYLIGNTITGKMYIGKKFLQHKKTKKLGKKAMAEQAHYLVSEFQYLEHGAHYAIGVLAIIMLMKITMNVSEMITGTIGIALISAAFIHSLIENRKNLIS